MGLKAIIPNHSDFIIWFLESYIGSQQILYWSEGKHEA